MSGYFTEAALIEAAQSAADLWDYLESGKEHKESMYYNACALGDRELKIEVHSLDLLITLSFSDNKHWPNTEHMLIDNYEVTSIEHLPKDQQHYPAAQ